MAWRKQSAKGQQDPAPRLNLKNVDSLISPVPHWKRDLEVFLQHQRLNGPQPWSARFVINVSPMYKHVYVWEAWIRGVQSIMVLWIIQLISSSINHLLLILLHRCRKTLYRSLCCCVVVLLSYCGHTDELFGINAVCLLWVLCVWACASHHIPSSRQYAFLQCLAVCFFLVDRHEHTDTHTKSFTICV